MWITNAIRGRSVLAMPGRASSSIARTPAPYATTGDPVADDRTIVRDAEIVTPAASRELTSSSAVGPVPITEVARQDVDRVLTGIEPLDRVLGGGLVTGSMILLGGDPGIGKSTLLAQMMASVPCRRLLYATGEETIEQAAMRAHRVDSAKPHIHIVAASDVDLVIEHAHAVSAQILVVDSIQTLRMASLPSAAGTVGQVRECTARLMRFAKDTHTTTILVGHINKDGGLAGPETLQHLVDAILQFELDPDYVAIRILRCVVKNRFGGTTETGSFEMTDRGLRPISKEDAPDTRRGAGREDADAMTPIAQEILYKLLELGGEIDQGLRDRICGRLDLIPRSTVVYPPRASPLLMTNEHDDHDDHDDAKDDDQDDDAKDDDQEDDDQEDDDPRQGSQPQPRGAP